MRLRKVSRGVSHGGLWNSENMLWKKWQAFEHLRNWCFRGENDSELHEFVFFGKQETRSFSV